MAAPNSNCCESDTQPKPATLKWGKSAPLSIFAKLHPVDCQARHHDAGDFAALASNFELFTILAHWFAGVIGDDQKAKHVVEGILENCVEGRALVHCALPDLENFPADQIDDLYTAYDCAQDALGWLCDRFLSRNIGTLPTLVTRLFHESSRKQGMSWED